MNLLRFVRVLAIRWWVIVLVGLIGAGIALASAEVRNRGLTSLFEATAPISVIRLTNENDDAYNRRLNTATAQARSALTTQLRDESLRVEVNTAIGTVDFIATSGDSDSALASAEGLRSAYLAVRPNETSEDQLRPLLDALAEEIALLESELAALQGDAIDPVVEAQRSALLSQINASASQLVAIKVELLNTNLNETERADAEARLAATEAVILALRTQLDDLPSALGTITDTRARLEASVVEQQIRNLESQYIAAALRRSDATNEGLVGEPSVADLSEEPLDRTLAALVGLVAGGLLGGIGVLAVEQINAPVRTVDDIPGLQMIKVSARPRKQTGRLLWYQTAEGQARRSEIQALRARLDRSLERGGVVAVGSVDVSSQEIADLSIDLASAFAATGRPTLYIDTQVATEPFRLPWQPAGPSLAEMLEATHGHMPDRAAIKRLLWDRSEVATNLVTVPAGYMEKDPIDALSGTAFQVAVEEARELVDIVVLGSGDFRDASAEAVILQASLRVVAVAKERTRIAEARKIFESIAEPNATVAAVVLTMSRGLTRRPVSGRRLPAAKARHAKSRP